VFAPGALDEVLPKVRRKAELMERLALVSSVLGLRRKRTHQLLSISAHRRYGFDLAISPGFEYLRSSARRDAHPRGIPLTASFIRRFNRCGFPVLFEVLASDSVIGKRLEQGLTWLFESRVEASVTAAVVKSAIALESLLIVNDSESLRGPLSERTAFMLADSSVIRRRIGKAIKSFYDLRSAVVHGGGRRRSTVSPDDVLEGIDRIVLLLMLTIAANAKAWATYDAAVEALEDKKWGATAVPLVRPFPGSHLTRAVQLLESAPRQKAT
jgi:hypothetical protein